MIGSVVGGVIGGAVGGIPGGVLGGIVGGAVGGAFDKDSLDPNADKPPKPSILPEEAERELGNPYRIKYPPIDENADKPQICPERN